MKKEGERDSEGDKEKGSEETQKKEKRKHLFMSSMRFLQVLRK